MDDLSTPFICYLAEQSVHQSTCFQQFFDKKKMQVLYSYTKIYQEMEQQVTQEKLISLFPQFYRYMNQIAFYLLLLSQSIPHRQIIFKIYNIDMQGQSQVKVIVVGDSGVGKSCLLLRYVNNQFNEFSQPTLGAAFLSKIHEYNNKQVRYQVWDTAGQQKYKSIASIYYRDSQVALCVYDITNKDSFRVLKGWVDQLKTKGPDNLLLVVVGNKIDRADDEQVSYTEVKEYAQSINAIFKLTSAKQGKGVNQLFTAIAERLDELKYQQLTQNRGTMQLHNQQNDKQHKKKCCG